MRLYLLTNKDEKRKDGFQFNNGLNVDNTWNKKDDDITPGGIIIHSDCYRNEEWFKKHNKLVYGSVLFNLNRSKYWIREAIIPKCAKIYEHWECPRVRPDYWKVDRIILKKRRMINCKIIEELYNKGDRVSQSGASAIEFAIVNKQFDSFIFLMNHGVAYNTGLWYAGHHGYFEGVQYIVDVKYPPIIKKWEDEIQRGIFNFLHRQFRIDRMIEYDKVVKNAERAGYTKIAECVKKHIDWH